MSKLLTFTLVIALLGGCGFFGFGKSDRYVVAGPDIGEVVDELPELRIPQQSAPPPTREEVLAAYEQVYGSIADIAQNAAVGKRLADLKMAIGEDADIAGDAAPYDDAVAMYESLLADDSLAANPDAEGRDQILYQLARAHDVKGKGEQAEVYLNQLIAEHPDSELILEARFRRAEMYFSNGRYREASAGLRLRRGQRRGFPRCGRTPTTCAGGRCSNALIWTMRWPASSRWSRR